MKIIHVYNQGLHHDVRTRRYGQALTNRFHEIEYHLIGQRLLMADKPVEILTERFMIIRLYFLFLAKNSGFLSVINFSLWLLNVLFYLLKQNNVKVISAHSLKVLPICVIVSILKRSKLIYDTHEIETHTTSNKSTIGLLTFVEKICMFKVSQIIVTSPGHFSWYKGRYKVPVMLVRNCPSIKEKPKSEKDDEYDLKKSLGLTNEDILYIYIGIINVSRGVNVILNAFQNCEKRNHILFLGFGDVKPILKLANENLNIHYMKPVPPLELLRYISTADVGLHMMDSSNLNHRMALPNKPMQYMAAGLPCIVSNVEVMAGLVKEANSGWIVQEGDVVALTNLINFIRRKDIEEYAKNAHLWFTNNNWELESRNLTKVYEQLF